MKPKIDIEYVANLARIRLTEEQVKNFGGQLADILFFMEKLNEVDTTDVPPTSHILPLKNVFREDLIEESLPVEKVLSNAPQRKAGLFKVPKIVEED